MRLEDLEEIENDRLKDLEAIRRVKAMLNLSDSQGSRPSSTNAGKLKTADSQIVGRNAPAAPSIDSRKISLNSVPFSQLVRNIVNNKMPASFSTHDVRDVMQRWHPLETDNASRAAISSALVNMVKRKLLVVVKPAHGTYPAFYEKSNVGEGSESDGGKPLELLQSPADRGADNRD